MTTRSATPQPGAEALFRWLLTDRPRLAWPTFGLFLAFVSLFVGEIVFATAGLLPIPLAVALGTLASYWSYSVLHEAAHNLVSTSKAVNEWVGRICLLGISITPFFQTYRFLHLAHHRFTNDPKRDADYWSGGGPPWTLPLRWMVMDVAYAATYFRAGFYWERPRGERIEFWASMLFGVGVLALVWSMGWLKPFLLFYILPTRLGLFILAFAFDFLPHYPHRITARENMFRATNNRVGMEWLMTPLLVGQNYHLAHHLYPTAPFYRYRRVWLARKAYHDARNPACVKPFGLSPTGTRGGVVGSTDSVAEPAARNTARST
ncbi:MAG: fatty acid desaturase [Kiritimatiellae bacterium]|nr:fatty acid desaturase [Kiritimatiellia bacterium]